MLQKEFFQVQPFNPNPYWDPVIVNLSGAQKFEEDTVFLPGRYRIEVAPGRDSFSTGYMVNMDFVEEINQPFIVRAYCGGDAADSQTPGTNPYTGIYKVNAVNATNLALNNPVPAIDVNHIFGAGGGNVVNTGSGILPMTFYVSGGANCLGDGNAMAGGTLGGTSPIASGAGSCLHILPVGGVFGSDYLRAYHAAPIKGAGSAYGGAGIEGTSIGEKAGGWFSYGGNSPYGNGATTLGGAGQGVGCGGLRINNSLCGAGARFDGNSWLDCHGTIISSSAQSSYIRITYLSPLNEEDY